ncbi:uncharacterized protein Dvir_GJ26707 [Drosophila virilis]|uniref:Protein midgut expression 1 n=1 Tax=Drosophila virilis TaxID=7244 RepID=A0A0Q9WAL4_DROVI|nr:uncharacterized protein LOC26531477 [Drosophila virilis]KRF81642.1 uncharacterized protein Dvir_GJ26707 [Drosophila virilis]
MCGICKCCLKLGCKLLCMLFCSIFGLLLIVALVIYFVYFYNKGDSSKSGNKSLIDFSF